MTDERSTRPGLQGQRVLITAGAAGIGLAIAERLIAEGARVLVCDVAEPALADFSTRFPQALARPADVTDEAAVAALVAVAESELGGLDALINNAGIAGPTGGVEEISPADWRRCLEVSLTGSFLCAHHAVPLIKAAGGGAIVNMSSAAGRYGYAFRSPYSSAKFGLIGFTQSLAKELGPANIRVNAILPGIIEGPRMAGVIRARAEQVGVSFEAMERQYLDRISLRRMTSPHDVAGMVAFLLSPDGWNISGQSLGVDGNVETL
ncbi:NAD(P)-dependent dehydrogenase, short-chain alcohol dehydrogenase family [Tistlia consotensis]|uniref:NAD(P)-dependent dehydrogenase, short-chain alcohol dehydrogenase family n=1 Tax=Tistlia consotensis USBA 355 TaxID=560819 RepID=A0A1Y6BNR2_9PROT|nr:SDR family oxidoreductase [Tistlia consotensis]SMF12364.1 NAD(P)-dependent dehydrogenase, short-chain alcohol dehydrogenase family [Tistlia consotensis USBA 355]SNR51166.1 NAD(P)-dependent dehydrogenase, short-chain alcohol dehydrogenase family [Tistlia consotensis]